MKKENKLEPMYPPQKGALAVFILFGYIVMLIIGIVIGFLFKNIKNIFV